MGTEQTPDRLQTDVVVIGGGAAGENAAARVVRGGLKSILVEAGLLGGECSYWACMPSKALLRPGTALHAARSLPGVRAAVTGQLDVGAVLRRRDGFTSHWDDASQMEWAAGAGIEVLRGRGRLTGERTVEMTDDAGDRTVIEARHAVVLATGSVPIVPQIRGLETVGYWGTREATSAKEIPARLAVLGGGVSGAELAQAFARLGSAVTLIARGSLLGHAPEQAGKLVAAALQQEGLTLHLHATTERISQSDDGVITLTLKDGTTVEADRLLVATGRHPALAGLGLEELGLDPKKLHPEASGLVAGTDWLYAVGDAAGKTALTHQGKYEARATGNAIAARANGKLTGTPQPWSAYAATADEAAVPSVVFTDPEVASVGRTLQQAQEAGISARAVELPISVAGSSLYADGYQGWAQMVVDEDRQVLVGVTFAGHNVGELLHSATIAVVGEVPLHRLWHAVPSYPTISEVWLRLLEKYGL